MLNTINDYINQEQYNIVQTEIRTSELYKQATAQHRPVLFYTENQRPTEDYTSLTDELLKIIEVNK